MKRISLNARLLPKPLALQTQEMCKSIFDVPMKTKADLLDHTTRFVSNPSLGENVTKQTLIKGLLPRVSYTRSSIESALKNANINSHKVIVDYPNEKTDVRGLLEHITANRFAEQTNSIKTIHMNSEKTNTGITAILSKSQTGQCNADIKIILNIKETNIELLRDIKSGNNSNHAFSGLIAEIPYIEQDIPYYVINDPIDISSIQKIRSEVFEKLALQYKEFKEMSDKFNDLMELPISAIDKNLVIQEFLFQQVLKHPLLMKTSFYYHQKIQGSLKLNEDFYLKLKPFISSKIFDNKKNYNEFIQKAIKIYCETIKDISKNIQESKSVWIETGFENIAEDLFH